MHHLVCQKVKVKFKVDEILRRPTGTNRTLVLCDCDPVRSFKCYSEVLESSAHLYSDVCGATPVSLPVFGTIQISGVGFCHATCRTAAPSLWRRSGRSCVRSNAGAKRLTMS